MRTPFTPSRSSRVFAVSTPVSPRRLRTREARVYADRTRACAQSPRISGGMMNSSRVGSKIQFILLRERAAPDCHSRGEASQRHRDHGDHRGLFCRFRNTKILRALWGLCVSVVNPFLPEGG